MTWHVVSSMNVSAPCDRLVGRLKGRMIKRNLEIQICWSTEAFS
jgi:hypothetical protein